MDDYPNMRFMHIGATKELTKQLDPSVSSVFNQWDLVEAKMSPSEVRISNIPVFDLTNTL